jgi:predicted PurR-regulated permease PerM
MKTNQIVRWLALGAVTLIALYLCWQMLQPFIEVLLWAVVLVIVFNPIHKRIVARTGAPGWSAMLSCLLVIVTFLLPLTLITIAVVNEMSGMVQNLQGNIQSVLDPDSPTTGRFIRWLGQYIDINQLRSLPIAERLKNMNVGGAIAGRTLGVISGLVVVIVEIFFVIFTMYYLFRDGDRLRRALREALPLEQREAREIFERTRDVISASVYGVLVIAAIQGALGGLAFWFLGLPSPLLWGVVMLFLSMIPMAGAFVVWVPAAIYLAVTQHYWQSLVLVGWGAIVIGMVDNFLRPKLVGEKTRLHELLIFFSVLGGLQIFGVLGLVLGPVVVAITFALLDVLRHAGGPSEGSSTGATGDAGTDNIATLVEEQAALRNVPAEARSEGG